MLQSWTGRRLTALLLMFALTFGNVVFGATHEEDILPISQVQEIHEFDLPREDSEAADEKEEELTEPEETDNEESVFEEDTDASFEENTLLIGTHMVLGDAFAPENVIDLSDSAYVSSKLVTIEEGGTYTVMDSGNTTGVRIVVDTTESVTMALNNITIENVTAGPCISLADGSDVTILLPDETVNSINTLTLEYAGIYVPETATLTISIPEGDTGTGSLLVGGRYGAAIGGNRSETSGNITIDGGIVDAESIEQGAAIGGGGTGSMGGDGGTILITGSAVVEAKGVAGAAIGGGYSQYGGGDGGSITINGYARVTVTVTGRGAGMGGGGSEKGDGGNGGNITIEENAVVTVQNDNVVTGAGIGGGATSESNLSGDGGNITIKDNAVVEAEFGHGAGIGGGGALDSATGGDGGTIEILGNARVTLKASNMMSYGAGIGGGGGASNIIGGGGGDITVGNNAVVTVEHIGYGAGIGGGASNASGGDGGRVTIINNGEVTVNAMAGAGIGGGLGAQKGGNGAQLVIADNAVVYAESFNSSGIGGGNANGYNQSGTGGGGGTVEIKDNAQVTAVGGNYCSGIGGAVGSKGTGSWSSERDLTPIQAPTYGAPAELTVEPEATLYAYGRIGYALHTINNELSGGANIANLYFWNDGDTTEALSDTGETGILGISQDKSHILNLMVPAKYTGIAFSGNDGVYNLITEETTPRTIVYRADLSGDLVTAHRDITAQAVTFGQPVSFTVNYDKNGGTGTEPQDGNIYSLGQEAVILGNTDLIYDGYEFKGWTDNSEGTGKVYIGGDRYLMNGDVTFYASWEKEKTYTVAYHANGGTGTVPTDGKTYKAGEEVTVLDNSGLTRKDYTFEGWTTNSGGTGTVYKAGDKYTINSEVTFYAKWKDDSPETPSGGSSGGGGGGTAKKEQYTVTFLINDGTNSVYEEVKVDNGGKLSKPVQPEREGYGFTGWFTEKECKESYDFETEVTKDFSLYAGWEAVELLIFTSDHFAYISGYPDGTIQPENNITRGEVASILYRLLDEGYKTSVYSTTTDFSDVSKEAWYGVEVATMSNAGVLDGYPDNSFKPGNNITRGEFAKVVAMFLGGEYTGTHRFTDINGHWAAEFINLAAQNGWIEGYPDGTYRPDNFISRAEAVAIFNRILDRNPETIDDLLDDMIQWPDNSDTAKWYYIDIQEASNAHTYERKDSGFENWVELY